MLRLYIFAIPVELQNGRLRMQLGRFEVYKILKYRVHISCTSTCKMHRRWNNHVGGELSTAGPKRKSKWQGGNSLKMAHLASHIAFKFANNYEREIANNYECQFRHTAPSGQFRSLAEALDGVASKGTGVCRGRAGGLRCGHLRRAHTLVCQKIMVVV